MDFRAALNILELPPSATREDVRRAYRELAKVWHPDRFQGDERLRQKAEGKLKDINEAYRVLQQWSGNNKPNTTHPQDKGPTATERPAQPRPAAEEPPRTARTPPVGSKREPQPTGNSKTRPLAHWAIRVGIFVLFYVVTHTAEVSRNLTGTPLGDLHPAPQVTRGNDPFDTPYFRNLAQQQNGNQFGAAPKGLIVDDLGVLNKPSIRTPVPVKPATAQKKGSLSGQDSHPAARASIGSTKDEVPAAQGTPTEFRWERQYNCWLDKRHGEYAEQRLQTIEVVYGADAITKQEYALCRSARWDEASESWVPTQQPAAVTER